MENKPEACYEFGEERAKRLYYLRKIVLKLSRAKFAKKHNIPSASLQNWEDVRYGGLTEQGALKLIKAFQSEGIECDINWLLYGRGDEPVIHNWAGKVAIPGISSLSASSVHADISDDIALAEELKTFYKLHQNAANTRITDDGLSPCYQPGYHVAGEKQFSNDIDRFIGEVCIIETQAGQIVVRRLMKGTQTDHYTLVCTNPTTTVVNPVLQDVKLLSAAPIIWIRKPRMR